MANEKDSGGFVAFLVVIGIGVFAYVYIRNQQQQQAAAVAASTPPVGQQLEMTAIASIPVVGPALDYTVQKATAYELRHPGYTQKTSIGTFGEGLATPGPSYVDKAGQTQTGHVPGQLFSYQTNIKTANLAKGVWSGIKDFFTGW